MKYIVTFQDYVTIYNSEANTARFGNYVVTFQNFVAVMTQEEYKAGMLQQTHNKDEDLRNCTYVTTFINFVATNLTKGKHRKHGINVATKPQQSLKTHN